VKELRREVKESFDSSELSADGLVESYVHCHEAMQEHHKRLQYLIDLHDKIHQVMSTADILMLIPVFVSTVLF